MSTTYTCPNCSLTFEAQWALTRHAHVHDPPGLPCFECERIFKRQSDLTRHLHSVHRNTQFVCRNEDGACGEGDCGKTFTRIDALRRHQKKKEPGKEGEK